MEAIQENKLLRSHPDTLQAVRNEINLAKPGEMKAAVKILKEWVQQQPHFKKKDFSEHMLENTIVVGKGSMERAKRQIDKVCTMRSLWPHFFAIEDIRTDCAETIEDGCIAVMPNLNKEHHRVLVVKVGKSTMTSQKLLQHYKFGVCVSEYLKAHDYVNSYHYVLDLRQANMTDFLKSFNLTDFRQIYTILVDCFGMRIKGIHLVSESKLVDTLIGILKQFLKPKLISRLHHYSDVDQLAKAVGEEYLPQDVGGKERCARDIQDDWLTELSSKSNMEYMRMMREATIDESLRPKGDFSQEYAGMPGTFRLLTVD
ncbi:uncharacterized protein LOC111003641 [Pieris rapae]|uniref:uncharacterized protein LOC111003641 n=1 Tax=Pieris rapae TaxID=64459 RepID=UPI001E280682|nr:uncharacterized protein LOC111003641 [Pieris rapae]